MFLVFQVIEGLWSWHCDCPQQNSLPILGRLSILLQWLVLVFLNKTPKLKDCSSFCWCSWPVLWGIEDSVLSAFLIDFQVAWKMRKSKGNFFQRISHFNLYHRERIFFFVALCRQYVPLWICATQRKRWMGSHHCVCVVTLYSLKTLSLVIPI